MVGWTLFRSIMNLSSTCPDDKYVHVDVVVAQNLEFGLKRVHEKIGISWGHFGAHCCAL